MTGHHCLMKTFVQNLECTKMCSLTDQVSNYFPMVTFIYSMDSLNMPYFQYCHLVML